MAGIYLHIPFCERKCIYCDFFSVTEEKNYELFVSLLTKELKLYSKGHNQDLISTIYFGGGTPSLLSPLQIGKILDEISKYYQVNDFPEVTIEVNPGTTSLEKLKGYLNTGVNRISIGVQSFHNEDLSFLTRIHNSSEAEKCINDAFEAGFENVSLDLIYALPTQNVTSIEANLVKALSYPIKHISAYTLIVEKNTPLANLVINSQIKLVSEELEAEMMEFIINYLHENGFKQYEVSNFAKSGYESKHNKNYWNHSNYLGCGPSAHSFWNRKRWWNVNDLSVYYDRLKKEILPIEGYEYLTELQIVNEKIFLGLRNGGVNLKELSNLIGKDFMQIYSVEINDLLKNDLATLKDSILKLTTKGYLITDEIASIFSKH